MSTPAEQALLAQILTEVRAVDAKVSGVEVTVAQALAKLEHSVSTVSDHEARIRVLEQADVVTKGDLEESQRERGRKTVAWFGVGLTILAIVESAVIALVVRG